jgi:arylsulfatase A-like enzyme
MLHVKALAFMRATRRLISPPVAIAIAIALSAASLRAGQPQPAPRPADHVVIISIDGLRPDYYLSDAARPFSPHLQALRLRGSWAEGVIGEYPSLTYPSHTSIATGMRPVHHGIVQNTKFDPLNGSNEWVFDASAIKTPALWNIASQAGLTTAAVSWPVTVGAGGVTYLFPETNQAPRDSTWLDLARRESTPGLIDAVVKRLGGFGPNDNRIPFQRDRFAAATAAYIIETWKPNLLMLHLMETDSAQHANGPDTPAAYTALGNVDARIGEVLDAIGRAGISDRTAVIVTGDHGFYRVHSSFQPNVVLRDAGLLDIDDSGRVKDWKAVAHRAAIKLKDPNDRALAQRVEKLFSDLAEGQYRGLFRVVGRDEIASYGGDPDALLMIEPVEGYTVGQGVRGGFLVPARGGAHGYLPTEPPIHTGLIMAGAGVRAGVVIPIARQIDIGPTAATLLGLRFARTDGVPMVGLVQQRTASEARSAR